MAKPQIVTEREWQAALNVTLCNFGQRRTAEIQSLKMTICMCISEGQKGTRTQLFIFFKLKMQKVMSKVF